MTDQQRHDTLVVYNLFTIQDLQTVYPYVNWLEYFNNNFHGILNFDQSEEVIVIDTNYLNRLNGLLESTSNRTIANYFAWRLVYFSSELMNDVLHNRQRQFFGQNHITPKTRLNKCIKKTITQ